jgi:hypothetical protein
MSALGLFFLFYVGVTGLLCTFGFRLSIIRDGGLLFVGCCKVGTIPKDVLHGQDICLFFCIIIITILAS